MFHNTYDRLRGGWWGATVAQKLIGSMLEPESQGIYCQPWLVERRQIATMLLAEKRSQSLTLSSDYRHLLSLMPLIMFSADSVTKPMREIISRNSRSDSTQAETNWDISGWEYLITTVLNPKFASLTQNKLIGKAIEYNRATESLLAEKLKLISELIENAGSLDLAMETLSASDASISNAIALAWYCFATTPHDFNLSVRKAARIPTNYAWLTLTLTGTLSGAYNGMTEISRYWRTDEQNSQEQIEHRLFQKLFTAWLGIYDSDKQPRYFHPYLDAVTLPQTIQPRCSLKIVSQTSYFE